jgi:virulence-associated protein VapD
MNKLLAAMLVLLVPIGCLADDDEVVTIRVPGVENTTRIADEVMSQAQGMAGINEAAGDDNLQFNGAAIAIGSELADTTVKSRQEIRLDELPVPMRNRVSIEDNAFSNARGAMSINQVSGAANSQANAIAITFGMQAEVFSDIELEQASAVSNLELLKNNAALMQGQVYVDDAAFEHAQGIIQLNQTAGIANRSANSLSIRVLE